MIVLDTNVISELMRPRPDPTVLAWVAGQPRPALYTSSINRAEVLYGVAALPAGRRRSAFEAVVAAILDEEFAGRVLPFDGTRLNIRADRHGQADSRHADRGLRCPDCGDRGRSRLRCRNARYRRLRGLWSRNIDSWRRTEA